MAFPTTRLRRLRSSESIRTLVRETRLSPSDLIYPLFVEPGRSIKRPIPSMPGQFRYSVDKIGSVAKEAEKLGIPGVLLFGVPSRKDERATEAYAKSGSVQRAVADIKSKAPGLCVITDVCLCQYTSHGHCGIVARKGREFQILNDPSLEILARVAVSHAEAGADIVAPSDMMDGRVGAIRKALDGCGFERVAIMSYAAKFSSAFYGPFRQAAESTPQFGDRRAYQMDPANAREAMREMELDVEEGADILMVKPALAYLDIIRRAREKFDLPLAAFSVSGEYAMLEAAAAKGWIEKERVMLEMLTAIRRAGADMILTYFAPEAAKSLHAGSSRRP
ncbi:MAG: porphobilinogen synthase [Nitrospirae bacterium]|nr:porphobilinogen synthase [Nitrospirota bacterium]